MPYMSMCLCVCMILKAYHLTFTTITKQSVLSVKLEKLLPMRTNATFTHEHLASAERYRILTNSASRSDIN